GHVGVLHAGEGGLVGQREVAVGALLLGEPVQATAHVGLGAGDLVLRAIDRFDLPAHRVAELRVVLAAVVQRVDHVGQRTEHVLGLAGFHAHRVAGGGRAAQGDGHAVEADAAAVLVTAGAHHRIAVIGVGGGPVAGGVEADLVVHRAGGGGRLPGAAVGDAGGTHQQGAGVAGRRAGDEGAVAGRDVHEQARALVAVRDA